ncbi:MAG: NAD(P)-dependent oxidoreductase [Candidatus Berkelbacteria bacterium]|nr:NAD(P)-dependent oxidoreductase [Candidatus Berkelbacteria bacterium]
MERLKIAIFGSDGFIGTHLLKLLSQNEKIELIPFKGNNLERKEIFDFFEENSGIDQVINLAGTFFGDFDQLSKVNLVVLNNILETATANKVGKIIYTSSGAVYGEPLRSESKESDPLHPNTVYGLVKKYCEESVLFYNETKRLEYCILRFSNVYGEGNNKGVIYNFLTDIEKSGKVRVTGDGEQSRNFLYVTDACEALEKAIFHKKSAVFNISNPIKVSINDILEKLRQTHKFEVEYVKSDNFLKDLLLNIDKAKEELGFEPKVVDLKLDL